MRVSTSPCAVARKGFNEFLAAKEFRCMSS